jgi:predicted kinase
MSTMVMLIGPTGCGKSTFRKKHLAGLPCVSPDDFVVGKWSAKKAAHAWQHARNMAIELLLEKQSFVVDAQFLDPAVRAEWQHLALGFGFETRGVVFDTSWTQLRQNQKARGARGHYGLIPYKVQLRSYQLMRQQLAKLKAIGGRSGINLMLHGNLFRINAVGILKEENDERAIVTVVKFGNEEKLNLGETA